MLYGGPAKCTGVASIVLLLILAAALHGAPEGIECRLERAQDSTLNSHVQSVVIPHMTKAPKIDGTLAEGEWLEAQPIREFQVPGTGEKAYPSTTAWLGVDNNNLYLACRCELIPGTQTKAEKRKRDGELWLEDSIEFFLHPDVSKPPYYQIIVNSIGARYDSRMVIEEGTLRWHAAWTPPSEVRAGREPDAWTLEMSVPLRSLDLTPKGIKAVRLNICRNDFQEIKRSATWAFLPTWSYHAPQHFGIGILTFGVARGKSFNLAGVTGWGGGDFLRTERKSQAVLLPQPHEVTARVALPDKLFADSKMFIEPRITPLVADGKEGDAFSIGKFRLTSSDPVKLSISGLQPGNYRLSLDVRGEKVALWEDLTVLVRAPNVEPDVVGEVVLDDHDWRAPDSVSKVEGIERELTPELLLKTELKTPVLAFDATDDETITCMAGFKGRLYVGACTQPSRTDTGSVFIYDPDLDLYEKSFQVNEQGLARMKVYGDRLYIPGYDANDGGWDLGNIYIHDGDSWIERRTVPRAIHIYGLVKYHDRIYVSADILDPPPEGMTFEEALGKDMLKCYGRVVSSGDEGKTWREEYRGSREGQDVSYMAVFKDKIVLNASGDLVIFDGEKWTPLGLNPAVFFVHDYDTAEDRLLLGTPFGLYFYDGEQLHMSNRFGTVTFHLRALERFGASWVLARYAIPGMYFGHGPGTASYPRIKDKDAPRFYSQLAVVSEGILCERVGTNRGESAWWNKVSWIDANEMCVSSQSFRGRLYLGTHPEGRVLVLPVVEKGSLESAPHRLERGGRLRLWWRAATPPGTGVRFQVRSAASIEELAKVPFAGPDGDDQGYFDTQGAAFGVPEPGYVQYKVLLQTNDPAKSPYVKRVILTRAE